MKISMSILMATASMALAAAPALATGTKSGGGGYPNPHNPNIQTGGNGNGNNGCGNGNNGNNGTNSHCGPKTPNTPSPPPVKNPCPKPTHEHCNHPKPPVTPKPPKPPVTPTPTPGSSSTSGSTSSSSSSSSSTSSATAGVTSHIGVDTSIFGGDQTATLTGGNQTMDSHNAATGIAGGSFGGDAAATGISGGSFGGTVSDTGNSHIAIDSSDRSVSNYKSIFIPPVVPATPPSQVAIGDIIKETMACGPLQRVVRTQINGQSRGIFSKSKVDQGFTYDLEPFLDKDGNIMDYRQVNIPDGSGYRLFGHQVVMFTTVIGVSSGGNIAIGGGTGGGSWGQAGGGSSSSNTRLVTNIQLVQCEIGTVKFMPVEKEVPVKRKRR